MWVGIAAQKVLSSEVKGQGYDQVKCYNGGISK